MALNHHKLFSSFTNVFSNPFEKGLELVFPDETVRQLINLDNHALRDGIIVPNNTQIRTIVFINRDLLLKKAGTVTTKYKVPSRMGTDEFDQQKVMEELGSLELVGRQVQYLNRVVVTANPPGAGPEFTLSPSSGTQGDAKVALTLTGDGLAGGALTSNNPALKFTPGTTSGDGKTLTATMDASAADPGKYTITLTTHSSAQSQVFEIKAAAILIDATQSTPPVLATGETGTVPHTVSGNYLKNASNISSSCADVTLTLNSVATTATSLSFKATTITSHASCTATVKDVTGASQTFTFKVQ